MREAADKSTIRKGKKAAQDALEAWVKEKQLSPEDFEQLDQYVDEAADKYSDLKGEWWSDYKAGKRGANLKNLEERMAREGDLLSAHQELTTEYREAGARAAVEGLTGGLLGPAGVLAAYAAYANGPQWDGPAQTSTEALWDAMQKLEAGESRMISQGNEVKPVRGAALWKTMNDTLDTAIKEGEAGNPKEMNLQYYELTSPETIGKVADAARAGNKVRLNLDAGRLSFPSRDSEGDYYFSLDTTPDKMRTILQLTQLKDADIGVSLFPQKLMLKSYSDLMHRKIMRYGDDVLISGMNANKASGENVDAGFIVKGPAAEKLGENFKRDVTNSIGATMEEIWGEDQIVKFRETNLRMGKRGFLAMLDSLAGPSPAGSPEPSVKSVEELEELAKKAKVNLKELVDVPADQYESQLTKLVERRGELSLSTKGKEVLQSLVKRAVDAVNSKENKQKLADITPPSGKKAGATRVDIADLPVEREAMTLKAISEADEFIYMPSFVLTRGIAAAIAARRDQLREDGKELDVRIIADSGLYPHGSTPNAYGIKLLEDHGVTPRWSKLERTHWHDRKIHAKHILTDKGEIAGSTNFSNKGLRENWETSAYVHFDDKDAESVAQRDQAKAEFEELWDSSYELNTKDHAAYLNRNRAETEGKGWRIEQDRDRSVRHILRLLLNYEKDTAKMLTSLVEQVPAIAEARAGFLEEGYSEGDATIMAVKGHVGPNSYRQLLDSVPANKTLEDLKSEVTEFKTTGKVTPDEEEAESADEAMVGALSENELTFRAHFV